MSIYWIWSSIQTNKKERGNREFGLERVDVLRCIGLVVIQMSLTWPLVYIKSWGLYTNFPR